jgi:hypothetical protein
LIWWEEKKTTITDVDEKHAFPFALEIERLLRKTTEKRTMPSASVI